MERSDGARLLFRGSVRVSRVMLWGVTACYAGLMVALLLDGMDGILAAGLAGLFALVVGGLWLGSRWMGAEAQVWAAEDALLVRRGRTDWLRVPWPEIRGGTWLHDGRANGPAITTTGGPYERPNPDWFTMPCQPLLPGGWRPAAAALRAELERHGIPWSDQVEERWTENKWTSTRWDW